MALQSSGAGSDNLHDCFQELKEAIERKQQKGELQGTGTYRQLRSASFCTDKKLRVNCYIVQMSTVGSMYWRLDLVAGSLT